MEGENMLKITLRRVMCAEDFAEEHSCALCGARFHVEGVYAWTTYPSLSISEPNEAACPMCVGHFGRMNPEFFPTIAEYDEAARRYPEPILSGEEDMMRLDNSIFFDEVYEAAMLSREDLAGA
jgi:hypothetical protein